MERNGIYISVIGWQGILPISIRRWLIVFSPHGQNSPRATTSRRVKEQVRLLSHLLFFCPGIGEREASRGNCPIGFRQYTVWRHHTLPSYPCPSCRGGSCG